MIWTLACHDRFRLDFMYVYIFGTSRWLAARTLGQDLGMAISTAFTYGSAIILIYFLIFQSYRLYTCQIFTYLRRQQVEGRLFGLLVAFNLRLIFR